MSKDTDQSKQSLIHDVMPRLFLYRIVFKYENDKPAYTVRKAESEPLAIQDFIRLNPKTKIYRVDFLNEA